MDHLTPGYREHRLRRHHKPHTGRVLVWGLLGFLGALAALWAAQVAPDGLLLAGLLAGLMFGATRE